MEESGHSLRYIEQDSLLHRMYPLTKLAWVFLVAIGLFLYHDPISGAITFAAVLVLALAAGKIGLSTILKSAMIIFGLGLLLMIFHFFADPGNPVYRIGALVVTDNGLRQGPVFFFRLSVVVLASFILIWTTDSRDLMVSLAKAGISYRFAFAIFLALRFLPLVQREVDAVQSAHAIRGQASRSGIRHRIKLWQRYMFTVLVNGLRKAEITADALECRAFGSYPDRTYVKDVTFKPAGLLLIFAFVVLIGTLVTIEKTGGFLR